jgi:Zn-dependent protease
VGTSLTLFQIRGIDVRVHWSFALILVYGAVSYAASGNTIIGGALYGVLVILLLFFCVTLHEFGHALVAQHYGISVPTITLLPIGGVASLERMPDKPVQELLIAIAGPLVNFALVFLLLPILLLAAGYEVYFNGVTPEVGLFLGEMRSPGALNLVSYLLVVNVMLALFNLLPAFPMDGGRILRALLAMNMPYVRATKVAVFVGRIMAVIFAVWGITSGNLFLLLIAFFVYVGGKGELDSARTRRALNDLRVRDILRPNTIRLYTSEYLGRAVDLVSTTYQNDFPVMNLSGELAGILTRDRLIQGLRGAGPLGRIVDYMVPVTDIPRASINDPLTDVWDEMAKSGARDVAVYDDNGQFLGLISADELLELVRNGQSEDQPASPASTAATDNAPRYRVIDADVDDVTTSPMAGRSADG